MKRGVAKKRKIGGKGRGKRVRERKTTDGMNLDGEMVWIRVDFSRQDRFSAGRKPVRMHYGFSRRPARWGVHSLLYGLVEWTILFYGYWRLHMAKGQTADADANRRGVPRSHCCRCRGSMHIPWTGTNHVLIRLDAEYINQQCRTQ